MSEETSVASPEDVPDEPPVSPRPPHRRRRRVTLIVGAVVAAMAVAVAVIALTASPANPYAAPHSVCALVDHATVAKYISGRPHLRVSKGYCEWSAGTSGDLYFEAIVVGSSTQARTGFTQEVKQTRKANTNKRTTVAGTPPVTGLGDQATVLFPARPPGADAPSACRRVCPGQRSLWLLRHQRGLVAAYPVVKL